MTRTPTNPEPSEGVYVIESDVLGILIDATDHGTLWTRNVTGWADVRTFGKDDGEAYIQNIRKDIAAETGDDAELRLVPATVDVPMNKAGQRDRCSRDALQNRGLVGDA